MSPALSDLTLLIGHQDQVIRLPESVRVTVSSDLCPYAAYVTNGQVLYFQGHPEFVHSYSHELLESCQQHLDEEFYRKGVDNLARDHQGTAVAEWMMRFVTR